MNKDEQIEELECLVGEIKQNILDTEWLLEELNEYITELKVLIGAFRETIDNLKD